MTKKKGTHDKQNIACMTKNIDGHIGKANTVYYATFDHLLLLRLLVLQAKVRNFSLDQMYRVKLNYWYQHLLT